MAHDLHGIPLTAGADGSAAAYDRAVDEYLSWIGDPAATLMNATARDPDFFLGHTTLAALNSLGGVTGTSGPIAGALAAAHALAPQASPRERAHLAAAEAWAAGDFIVATAAWEAALAEEPRDILALRLAHDTYFYLGDAEALRESPARVLPAWAGTPRIRGFVQGMHAFGLEETGDYPAAERSGRTAIETNPGDSWAIHAVAHVLEMQGKPEAGVSFLEELEHHWRRATGLACHHWWHLALYLVELGRLDAVLAIYDDEIRGTGSTVILDLVDAGALLWRLELLGIDVGTRWQALAEAWLPYAEDHALAFNDAHIMMTVTGAGLVAAADRLDAGMTAHAAIGIGTNAGITRDLGLPVARALRAFREKRYGETVDLLLPRRHELKRIGGSNAQRDLFIQTLVLAALAAGRDEVARTVIAERAVLKSGTPRAWTGKI
jgi:tetratricopeptide (TPR) repeat protein